MSTREERLDREAEGTNFSFAEKTVIGALVVAPLLLLLAMFTADTASTIALVLAFLPGFIFVVFYLNEFRAIKITAEGKHILTFTLLITIIVGEELMMRWLGRWAFHDVAITVFAAALSTLMWQRVYMLFKYQILPRRRRRQQNKEKRTA